MLSKRKICWKDYTQEVLHRGVSPFIKLHNLDMIRDFPLDYLHQVCLGVMKKLLLTWIRGPRAMCRMSATQNEQVSANLNNIRKDIPREFTRKPRGLDEVERWKGTEFRQFLLYTGTCVIKGVLPQHNYDHFMALSLAMCILVNSKLTTVHSMETMLTNYCNILLANMQCCMEVLSSYVHAYTHYKRSTTLWGSR